MRLPHLSRSIVALIMFMTIAVAQTPLDLPLQWTVNLNSYLETAATLADIDGDGLDEVLVAGREELFALDGDGTELWRYKNKTRYMTYPAVLMRDDAPALIYMADTSGHMSCVDGLGKEIWTHQLSGPANWVSSVVCDLTGDGIPEVVQPDDKGEVGVFNALDGTVIWKTKIQGDALSPAVADLDGDGRQEIAVATCDGILFLLNADGAILWSKQIGSEAPSWGAASPIIFGASDGSSRIAISANEGRVVCLDPEGTTRWEQPLAGPTGSALSVGDIDLDGRADIFALTQTGQLYRFEEDGGLRWNIDMQGRCLAGGAILDINADGALEFVFCTQPGRLFVVNEAGEFIYDYLFAHRTINITPTFGELSKATPGLELVITGGEAGLTHCFSTPAQVDGPSQWIAYHADIEKTAAWFGLAQSDTVRMSATNLSERKLLAGEPVVFEISLPDRPTAPVKASALCQRPDGARETAFAPIIGNTGALQMPVSLTSPGTYQFSWALQAADDTVLFTGEKTITVQPLANERALFSKTLAALNTVATQLKERLPATAHAVQREAVVFQATMQECLARAERLPQLSPGDSAALMESMAALVAQARHLDAMATLLKNSDELAPSTSLLVFEGPQWECVDIATLLPQVSETALTLNRTVVPEEYEAVSLKLFNITGEELQVRVRWETESESIVVSPLQSRPSPTSKGDMAWDPMPSLGSADIITIPPLRTREVWLNLALGAIPPGDHSLTVFLEALNGAGVLGAPRSPRSVPPPTTTVDIALDVIPFTMAPPGAFRMCTWSRNDDAAVADMLAHGSNVFITGLPAPIYAGEGSLSSLDMDSLNTFVEWFEGHDVFLLLSGAPRLNGKVGDAVYAKELAVYLNLLVAELAALGYDKDHFALYSHDEPGGHGWHAVHAVVDYGKAIHAVDPDIMIYVNGGGEAPMFQELAEVTGVWCPGINMLPEKSAAMEIVRNTGKHFWTYNCSYSFARPMGPNIKGINVVGEFRLAALQNFTYGATGMGYWSYNISEYPWGRIRDEYTLTYPGREQVVSSRRWEAVREGIEDCRIALALKARLNDSENPLPAGLAARIRDLFEEQMPEHFDQSMTEMLKGVAPYAIDRTNNDAIVQRFRDELIACAAAIAQLD